MREPMVRKQIYLPKNQDRLLKRLARQRGVSEAEVIRQALERESHTNTYPIHTDMDGWESIQQFVRERQATYAGVGKPYQWNRQELYEERENRWFKHHKEE